MNWRLGTFVLMAIGVAAVVLFRPGDGAEDPVGEPLLPNLWTSAPFELTISEVEGRTVLRFTSEMNNRGAGDLLLRGDPNGSVSQWVRHSESGHSTTALDVDVVWGGDTHDHWHIEDVARYWIADRKGNPVGDEFDNKVGFCVFDSVDFQSGLLGAPETVRHRIGGCGTRLSAEIAMGLSVGWGDQYRFSLEGQYIDIEDLAAGEYRLMAEVDPDRRLNELDRKDNVSWTDFTLEIQEGQRLVQTP